jgi:tetratricopeptide (TPR) repeat protein
VVRKLLAKNREDRYASAAKLIADLKDYPAAAAKHPAFSPRNTVAVILLVLLLSAAWWIFRTRSGSAKPAPRQVVVLPFENPTAEEEGAAFGDGLSEVVAGLLTRRGVFPDTLWVVPPSDVRRFGVNTVADAGRMFPASLAIGGTVKRTLENAGWVIALAASDSSPPHLMGSREIQVKDLDTGDLEAKLTSALVDLLDLKRRPVTQNGKTNPPTYARFVVARGHLRQYDRGDNLKLAISELQSIAAATPDFAPAQVALGEAYFRMYTATKQEEWLAKADQSVRGAAEIDESDPDIPVMRARILRATGQTEAAIRELRVALARDPGNEVALVQLAGAYESSKQFPEAVASYQEAIRLRPSFFPAYSNLGIFYMSQGNWKQAEEPLTIVTKLAPEYADGYTTLGSLMYYQSRLDDAERLFTRSIQLRPTATAFSNRCAVEFDNRAMQAAVADCRKAVELQPASAVALGNLGDALAESGAAAEAINVYHRALDAGNKLLAINPASPDLLAIMAKFAAKTGQKGLAIELASKALSQGSGVRTLYNAGKAYGLAGQCSRSVDLLKQAFGKGYPYQDARRDPDLAHLRAAPFACAVPPI